MDINASQFRRRLDYSDQAPPSLRRRWLRSALKPEPKEPGAAHSTVSARAVGNGRTQGHQSQMQAIPDA